MAFNYAIHMAGARASTAKRVAKARARHQEFLKLRAESGWSYEVIAHHMGVSPATIIRWVRETTPSGRMLFCPRYVAQLRVENEELKRRLAAHEGSGSTAGVEEGRVLVAEVRQG